MSNSRTDSFDRRVWREKADPLISASDSGPLTGETLAVKDLFAVKGHPIGAGNPQWLSEAKLEQKSAPVVDSLLNAGAEITGISQTDEFALSLAGTNAHYGTPPNPAAPGRICGGSSNGSASAVALGEVSIGLGTDTGGSIRVPAAYQGLWGIRTTHDVLPREGLMALADSFDAIGWMTRTPALLAAVAEVLTPKPKTSAPPAPAALGGMGATSPIPVIPKGPVAWEASRRLGELKYAPSLLDVADRDVAQACGELLVRLERLHGQAKVTIGGPDLATLEKWVDEAFVPIQSREAWTNHGDWISEHWEHMTPDVGGRFRAASEYSANDEVAAREVAARARQTVRSWVGDGVLALPSACSVAPLLEDARFGSEAIAHARRRNQFLTCLAGLGGLPAVNIPTTTAEGLPTGLSLIGPQGSDKALIAYAAVLADKHA